MTISPPRSPLWTPRRIALPGGAWPRSARTASVTAAISGPLLFLGAEDAAGPEDQDQNQHAEGHHRLELVRRRYVRPSEEEAGTHALQHAQGDTPDARPQDVADAPKDRGGEGLDARDESHEVVHLVEHEHEQDPGRPGQEPADGEGRDDHPVDVDAHERGDLLVLADRTHSPARLGSFDEEVEAHHQDGPGYAC